MRPPSNPRSLAFSDAPKGIWVRSLDSIEPRYLEGTEGGLGPFWSPDSRSVGFVSHIDGKLKKVALAGGPAVPLCDAPPNTMSTWNDQGTIVFGGVGSGLFRVSAEGGDPVPITTLDPDSESFHTAPWFLPDGRHFLYKASRPRPEGDTLLIGSLDSDERTVLIPTVFSNAVYSMGHILFFREGTLLARPFDAASLAFNGDAKVFAEAVAHNQYFRYATLGASAEGTIAYAAEGLVTTELLWFDRTGDLLGQLGPADYYQNPALSPDETRVAVDRVDIETGDLGLWLIDVSRGSESPEIFSHSPAVDNAPTWSQDGTEIAFVSSRAGFFDIFRRAVGGAAAAEPLVHSPVAAASVTDWHDAELLLYQSVNLATQNVDQYALRFGAAGQASETILASPLYDEMQGRLSPGGDWLVYTSNETTEDEVYVLRFPDLTDREKVSLNGGYDPKWGRNGDEVYYLTSEGDLVIRPFNLATGNIEEPQVVLRGNFRGVTHYSFFISNYDVTSDGNAFLVNVLTENAESPPLTVVVNWTSLLEDNQ